MRQILVDWACSKAAVRHSSGQSRVVLDEMAIPSANTNEQVLLVEEALGELAAIDAPAAELVTLRFFAGSTLPQAAELLGISERTARRLWVYARPWLHLRLQNGG